MRTRIENVDVHITTITNSLPTSKPAFGRFRVLPEQHVASFIEEESKVVICGEPKSRRLLQGKGYSVWYNEEKNQYKVRITLKPSDLTAAMMAQCDFEECINFIKRRENEKEEK